MKNIDKVIACIGGLAHGDDRRDLYELYNNITIGNGETFSAKQIKLARVKDQEENLLGDIITIIGNFLQC